MPFTAISFILWEARPEIWPEGPIPLRWYGLFFAMAFALGQVIITRIFKSDGKDARDVDALTYYMILGTVLGARLGHCLFYQPDYYLANPIEILKIWEGGLASHGATVGIIFAMWLYSRSRKDQSWLWILDRIVIVVALGGSLIRLGNLMNSEIIGKPSDLAWSMVFLQPFETALREHKDGILEDFSFLKDNQEISLEGKKYQNLILTIRFRKGGVDQMEAESYVKTYLPALILSSNSDEENLRWKPGSQPEFSKDEEGNLSARISILGVSRHPAMVYESISTFLLFIILYSVWSKRPGLPEGRIFGLFVVILFSLRFFYEFLKENQVDFEDNLSLNMGQFLSIPLVIAGFWILLRKTSGQAEGNQAK
jgi:prolipoprotein diacylglyceryltransferase